MRCSPLKSGDPELPPSSRPVVHAVVQFVPFCAAPAVSSAIFLGNPAGWLMLIAGLG